MSTSMNVSLRIRLAVAGALIAALSVGPTDTRASEAQQTPALGYATSAQTGIKLMSSVPRDGAKDVGLGEPIALHFSRVQQPGALTGLTYTLIGPSGPEAIESNVSDSNVTIKPARDLLPASRYTVFVSQPTADLGSASSLSAITFTTAVLNQPKSAATDTGGTASVHMSTGSSDAKSRERCDSKNELRGYRFCHDKGTVEGGVFVPGFNNTGGRWRTNAPLPDVPKASDFPAGTFNNGATAVFGVVRRIDDAPVAGVTVSLGKLSARTDAKGRFVLSGTPDGHQVLFVDGASASHGDVQYGQFDAAVELKAQTANPVPFNLYLPKISARDKISVSSPTSAETVVTHPGIPGLELHIPAGTVFRDRNGKVITELSIVPMPVDRSPIPAPENFLVYVSVQPGEATVDGLSVASGAGLETIYPNYANEGEQPGSGLWYYDAERDGWAMYSVSTVSTDGENVVPQSKWGAKRLMPKGGPPAVGGNPPTPPSCHGGGGGGFLGGGGFGGGLLGGGGDGTSRGDPVDCSTGNFLNVRTDLAIPDATPLRAQRLYNSGDTANRSFGRGSSNGFEIYLHSPVGSCVVMGAGAGNEIDFVAPEGTYSFTAANGSVLNSMYGAGLVHKATPSRLYGAVLHAIGESAFVVQLKDGTLYTFNAGCPSNLRSVTDRFGKSVALTYNAGLLSKVSSPSGRYLSFAYNADNHISQVADQTGRNVSYTYSGNLLTAVNYPDNTTERYTYDSLGNMKTVVDRRGNTMVINQYDANNRVTGQTYADNTNYQFAYTLTGGNAVIATDVTDTRGTVEHLTFDAGGYLLSMTKAYGTSLAQTTTFTRGQDELVTSRSDQLGRVITTTFNTQGDVLTRTYLADSPSAVTYTYTYTPVFHDLATVTDPLNHSIVYGYKDGCINSVTDALGNTTSITCNAAGQPLTMTDALNHTTVWDYLGVDLRSYADALNRITTFSADSLGRTFATQDPLGRESRSGYDVNDNIALEIDGLSQQTLNVYDGNGNLTSVTDPNGGTTQYAYDARNRRISRTDALNQVEHWTYDGQGNVLTYTDRKNQVTQYQYDALNRVSLITFADGSTVVPTFDAGNRPIQIADSVSGTIMRSYDGLDNLLQEATPQGTVAYTYDAAGRRATMTPAAQPQILYTYDDANRLTAIAQGTESVGITYDNANRRTALTLPNGVITTYTYDVANELLGLTYKTSGGVTLGSVAYAYDAAGQRVSQSGGFRADLLPSSTTGPNTFDLDNRQTLWNGYSIGYDQNGDANSNATTAPAMTYVFDARHRLIQIQQNSTTIATFVYDTFNRRTNKTIGAASTSFLYDGVNPIQEAQGTTIRSILTGLGVDERFARDDATYGRSSFLTDALGSTIALTDANQAVRQTYQYEAYGEVSSNGSSDNPYQYTGRENDGIGLYYYRERYFSPITKRFLSEDPLGLIAGLNSYSYVHNSPIDRIDPDGLQESTVTSWCRQYPEACAAAAGAGAAATIPKTCPDCAEMSKGGKQNIDNEYTRQVKALGSSCPDPCEYLKELYRNESNTAERMKIKTALKYFNCDGKDRFGKQ